MLNIDPWNIFFTIINLLVLYIAFKKFLFDKVMGVIQERENLVKKQFEDAKKNEEEAKELKKTYKEKIKTAREEADRIVLDARARAEEEHNLQVEKTKAETLRMMEKAKEDMANEQEKATKEAQAEIAKLAVLAARKIMKTGDAHDTGSSK